MHGHLSNWYLPQVSGNNVFCYLRASLLVKMSTLLVKIRILLISGPLDSPLCPLTLKHAHFSTWYLLQVGGSIVLAHLRASLLLKNWTLLVKFVFCLLNVVVMVLKYKLDYMIKAYVGIRCCCWIESLILFAGVLAFYKA